jgi:hypothetical protein
MFFCFIELFGLDVDLDFWKIQKLNIDSQVIAFQRSPLSGAMLSIHLQAFYIHYPF